MHGLDESAVAIFGFPQSVLGLLARMYIGYGGSYQVAVVLVILHHDRFQEGIKFRALRIPYSQLTGFPGFRLKKLPTVEEEHILIILDDEIRKRTEYQQSPLHAYHRSCG
jgi:hypothetical protein